VRRVLQGEPKTKRRYIALGDLDLLLRRGRRRLGGGAEGQIGDEAGGEEEARD
jgi:hypothetical protein